MLILAVLIVGLCGPAQAHSVLGHIHQLHLAPSAMAAQRAYRLQATPSELTQANIVAMRYWKTLPSCGQPQVAYRNMPSWYGGEADYTTCTIALSLNFDYADFPNSACLIYVHEYGHLVLGPDYFAASNPADPSHSPDPANIMYGTSAVPQQTQQERSVGCPTTP